MKEDHYITLIHKNLSGDIDQKEQGQLDQWLSDSPDNLIIAEHIRKSWEHSGTFNSTVDLDMDADFAQLQKKIKTPKKSKKKKKQKVTAPTTSAKVRPLQKRSQWTSIAAGILFLIIAGFLANLYMNSKVVWQVATTSTGQTQTLELADGTKVTLNENSELRYPSAFRDPSRLVELTGEAFFDVSKNQEQAFVVKTHSSEVSVLGTRFTVKDTPEQYFIEVAVQEGKVKLQPNAIKENLILEANEKGIYQKEWYKLTKKTNNSLNIMSWYTKKLTFENKQLGEVLMEVQRHYKVQIYVNDGKLLKCNFTSTFDHAKLDDVLKAITGVFGMEVEQLNEKTYRLKGGNCQ